MDLSKMSDDDLLALKSGDLSKISTETLKSLAVAKPVPFDVQPGVASAMNIGQSLTMGFGDELAGAVSTLGGGNYTENRDRYRATVDKFKEENPKSALLGALSGGLLLGSAGSEAVPAALAKYAPGAAQFLTKPLTTADTLKNAAVIGGIAGSAQGAGDASTMKDVPAMAALGLGLGAVGGVAGEGVVAGGGEVAKRVGAFLSDTGAGKLAQVQIARALIRDTRAAMGGLKDVPDLDVLDMAVKKASGRLEQLGGRAVLADAGPSSGAETRGLLDTMATLPGETKGAVSNLQHQRIGTRSRVLQDSAAEGLSPGGTRSGDLINTLNAKRSAESAPLYDQLHSMEIDTTPELYQSLSAMQKLGALKEARGISEAEVGVNGPSSLFTLPPTADPTGTTTANSAILDLKGNPYPSESSNIPQSLKVKDLDRAKQGLDQMIQGEIVNGRMTPKGRALQGLKNFFVQSVDDATVDPATGVSLYKTARDTFAGPSSMITAAKLGRTALAGDDAAVKELTQGMSESELQAFKVGAFEALRDKLGTQGGATNIMNMWKEPKTSDKLKEIFGDLRSFRTFAADVAKESRIKRLETVGVGSQTAGREARMDDLNSSVLSDIGDAAKMVDIKSPSNILQTGGRLWNRVATPEPVRNAIGNALLSRPTSTDLNGLASSLRARAAHNASSAAGLGVSVPNALQFFQ